MKFTWTDEQQAFASSLESLLSAADTVSVARAWAEDDTESGLKLWGRLAEQGINALMVSEEAGGMGATGVELAIAFEALGRHAVPGPWVESAAYLPVALGDDALAAELAEGAIGTVAVAPHVPHALDADVATHAFVVDGDRAQRAAIGERLHSVDNTRRLFRVSGEAPATLGGDLQAAFDTAALATAAQLLGAGERLLDESVAYVKQRRQFGREIGSYQAIKHMLADVRIALDFARPLVNGAALGLGTPEATRDVAAAKVYTAEAAYLSSRVALQVHGAIGYTRELDLSLWLIKVRALLTAWGTPAHHRGQVLDALVEAGA
ncbi:acyl-CoA dehydrogenase family protein [Nocardioides alcanivorans]|uniref:acyl-CoA dehydrogenase family protein n=1 Tax=Nocardioides alcanivorans TaxID=2897352 RepID=UPI001F4831B0|nr:acyl-CoA dehydrogenase family protein [Nocardioides alcanivorans]